MLLPIVISRFNVELSSYILIFLTLDSLILQTIKVRRRINNGMEKPSIHFGILWRELKGIFKEKQTIKKTRTIVQKTKIQEDAIQWYTFSLKYRVEDQKNFIFFVPCVLLSPIILPFFNNFAIIF